MFVKNLQEVGFRTLRISVLNISLQFEMVFVEQVLNSPLIQMHAFGLQILRQLEIYHSHR